MKHKKEMTILGVALLVVIVGYGTYSYNRLTAKYQNVNLELASTKAALDQRTQEVFSLRDETGGLEVRLNEEVARNNSFDEQIKSISSTVGLLDKLSKTDKELLQKYSKVYFLNENFIPSALSDIDKVYLYKGQPEKIHASVRIYLERMLSAAASESITLYVLSGYRSFGAQASLKANYKTTYGSGANRFSADQGFSEHQLGSAVDFTTTSVGETLSLFGNTPAHQWLTKNAYKYGFILSYPKENKFYQYEPWHWRFVGVELATKLYNEKTYFYALDQREIDGYLVKIFD